MRNRMLLTLSPWVTDITGNQTLPTLPPWVTDIIGNQTLPTLPPWVTDIIGNQTLPTLPPWVTDIIGNQTLPTLQPLDPDEVMKMLIAALNYELEQLKAVIKQLNIGKDCKDDLTVSLDVLQIYANNGKLSEWDNAFLQNALLPMIDATAKLPPSGILRGHFIVFGEYDECMLVKQKLPNSTRVFTGSYVRIMMDTSFRDYREKGACVLNQYGIADPALDVCVPSSCNQEKTLLILARNLIQFNGSCPVCLVRQASVPYRPTDYKTWIVVAVLIFFGLIAIAATAYDLYAMYFDFGALTPLRCETTRWFRCLMAFSVIRNTQDVFNIKNANKPGQIGPIHFMRFISMAWVVVGHTTFAFMALSTNMLDGVETLKNLGTQILANAFFSVDTFFYMSGVLVAFMWFKEYYRNKARQMSAMAWTMFYVHRIVRLSPPYYITIAFYAFVFKTFIVNMPTLLVPYDDSCESTWWTNFLYLNNFIDYGNQCYTVSWYLATDLQMHLFAPVLLVPLAVKPVLGYITAGVLILLSTIANLVTMYKFYFPPTDFFLGKMDPRMGPIAQYALLIYDAPWIRCQVYIIGILVGYLLQTRKTLRIPRLLNLICWIISVALGFLVVMCLRDWIGYGTIMSLSARAFYSAFSKLAWGLAIAYVTIACYYGHGGPINDFMSLPIWIPLGRLSYCTYLSHLAVLLYIAGMGINDFTFSNEAYSLVIYSLPSCVFAWFFAYWLSILFEISAGKVEMVFLGRARGRVPEQQLQQQVHPAEQQRQLPIINAYLLQQEAAKGVQTPFNGRPVEVMERKEAVNA